VICLGEIAVSVDNYVKFLSVISLDKIAPKVVILTSFIPPTAY